MPKTGRPPIRGPRLCAGPCKTVWPESEFRRGVKKFNRCRTCQNARTAAWARRERERNPAFVARRNRYRRDYYRRNREKEMAHRSEFREQNRELLRARAKRYRLQLAKKHFAERGHTYATLPDTRLCRICVEQAIHRPYTAIRNPDAEAIAAAHSGELQTVAA